MKAGKPTGGNPLNINKQDKIVTLRLRIGRPAIRQLFKMLSKSQLDFHEEWLLDREVDEAAELIKADDPLLPF